MLRIVLIIFILAQGLLGVAQITFRKLELGKNEKYFIEGSLILVTDTLLMADSSEIVLNPLKKENIINSRVTIIGKGCKISGVGASSKKGKDGIAGIDQAGPCLTGKVGGHGTHGLKGIQGNNLTLHLTDLIINGSLTINLNGGEGGDGGDGGRGGGGGPGTKVCTGGSGGDGGHGANGGDGGEGGTLSFQCKNCPTVRGLINKSITVKNYGGYAGLGGNGGIGGLAGLGPKGDGANGKRGLNGKDGLEGKNGAIKFLSN
jgi:hypothetical protein